MVQQWGSILEAMTEDVERRVGEMELLSGEERRQVLEEWNRTEEEYGEFQSVGEVIGDQARLHGEAVAVVYAGEELRYGI